MNLPQSLSGLVAKRAGLAGFVTFFLLGSATYVSVSSVGPGPRQAIAFNHAKHIENSLNCTDCHSGVQTQAKATLPALDVCLGCHQTALSSSPEEEKIRSISASGQELNWAQVTMVAPHVFFSHRRHVTVARLSCAECHGPMEKMTKPPLRPWRAFTMNTCIGCHEKNKVNADCNDCHR